MPSLSVYKHSLDYSYATGYFPAMEALKHCPERVKRILISAQGEGTEAAEKLSAYAQSVGVRVEQADRILQKISGKENCYAAAVFEKMETALSENTAHIVLHHPSDSGNLGTILRTSLGFGFEDIALIRPCADVFDPHVVRASMGSLFQLRVKYYACMEDYIAAYPQHALYLFMLRNSLALSQVLEAPRPALFSLVFGNEGSGLPDTFASLGQPVHIESNLRIDSLNLSVAAAIGCYAFRQA